MLSEDVLAQAIIKNVKNIYSGIEPGGRLDDPQLEALGRGIAAAVLAHLRTSFQASGASAAGPVQITGCY